MDDIDFIIIANENENIARQIKQELISMGIVEKKIVWNRPIPGCPLYDVVWI